VQAVQNVVDVNLDWGEDIPNLFATAGGGDKEDAVLQGMESWDPLSPGY
jgi:hypothetical protein